jgi:hypothetical protein
VEAKVDIIFASVQLAAASAKRATTKIPIVLAYVERTDEIAARLEFVEQALEVDLETECPRSRVEVSAIDEERDLGGGIHCWPLTPKRHRLKGAYPRNCRMRQPCT